MTETMIPPFLRKLDRRLLENEPFIWASRIHYLFPAMILLNLLGALVGLGIRLDLRDPMPQELFAFLMSVPSVAIFFYWGFKTWQFRIEAFSGKTYPRHGFFEFLVWGAAAAMIFLLPFVAVAALQHNYRQTVSYGELLEDARKLDLGSRYFLNESDRFEVFDSREGYRAYVLEGSGVGILPEATVRWRDYLETARLGSDMGVAGPPEAAERLKVVLDGGVLLPRDPARFSGGLAQDGGTAAAQELVDAYFEPLDREGHLRRVADFLAVYEKYNEVYEELAAEDVLADWEEGIGFYYLDTWRSSYQMDRFAQMHRPEAYPDYDWLLGLLLAASLATISLQTFNAMPLRDFVAAHLIGGASVFVFILGMAFVHISGDSQVAGALSLVFTFLGVQSVRATRIGHPGAFLKACVVYASLALPFVPLVLTVLIHPSAYFEFESMVRLSLTAGLLLYLLVGAAFFRGLLGKFAMTPPAY